jgi:hypothetical protein
MNISRGFLIMGALYLIVGIIMGSYMGASQDHTLMPVHAHINLLGFTLMTIFGLAYRLIPGLAGTWMAPAQFWLHQAGALCLLIGLYLMMSGIVAPETVGPFMPPFELAVLASVVLWAVNLWRNAR